MIEQAVYSLMEDVSPASAVDARYVSTVSKFT